jgi:hypothetical protein
LTQRAVEDLVIFIHTVKLGGARLDLMIQGDICEAGEHSVRNISHTLTHMIQEHCQNLKDNRHRTTGQEIYEEDENEVEPEVSNG